MRNPALQSILSAKIDAKILLTHSVNIIKISAIVLIFILGLSEIIGGFFVFSGIIALTERTERGASFMLVRPHLKSLKYRKMVHKMEMVCRYTSQAILQFAQQKIIIHFTE